MEKSINPKKLRTAPILSTIFMGLGQVVVLKEYLRGFILMAFEVIILLNCSSIFNSVKGLITLGDPHPELPIKLKDHSIFMMITGIITLVVLAIFIITYVFNVKSAKKSAEEIIKNGKYPSRIESRNNLSQKSFPSIGILPCILMVAIFTVIPLVFSILVAFTNYS